jgi:putative SOS response-associated peptidase YedK
MCGRFALHADRERLAEALDVAVPEHYHPRFNIAPTQTILTLHRVGDERRLVPLRWGLVPAWSKGPDSRYSMINARAETAHVKPAFRGPFRHHRCLIPASGFYEWSTGEHGKQPWYIRPADGPLLLFAGLWDRWNSPDGHVDSCTILTTAANTLMASLHDRMPAILDAEGQAAWLDPATDQADLRALLIPAPDELLAVHPVGRQVNNPRHEHPDCIEAIGAVR